MASDQVRRIFTATCVIGVPGSGKTALFDGFSVYLWETFRKVLLLYSWDGGAIPTQIQKRMQQGLIRYWRARTRSAEGLGIETVYLASKGYWPRHINPLTGETSPGVDLVAPVTTQYTLSCPAGHPLKTVTQRALITPSYCGDCKQMIAIDQIQIVESAQRTKGFEQVGGVGFDGLTSMSNVVMDHMDHARGAGQIGGEKPAFGGVVQSGGVKMGGNNRADVGFGQSRAQQFVNNSLSIPYLVEGPVFTALSMEATDEGGLSIVGGKLPGRAATDEMSAWFGNVCEMGKTLDDAGKSHFTLFLRPFTDAQGRRHLLKTSASPMGLPDMLIDPPESEHRPGAIANLGDVFRGLDADLTRAVAENDIKDAPGVGAAPVDYGEALISGPPPPSFVATPAGPTLAAGPLPGAVLPLSPPVTVGPAVLLPGAPPAMAPRARPRKRQAAITLPVASPPAGTEATPAVSAATPAAPLATTEAPVAPQQPASPVAPQAPPSPPVMGQSTGGPPPPPGMRPPQRAPGS
jgi:hypothetical protein